VTMGIAASDAWLESSDWQPRQYVDLQPVRVNGRKPLPDGLVHGYVDPAAPAELLTEQDFIDVKTAAGIVGLHTKVIRRAIDAGELTAYKLRTRIRIRRTDFDASIDANRVEPSIHDIEPWQ
jgi:excisionase family DNA binding protein